MKKKLTAFILSFVVAFVAFGALDCGCVFANVILETQSVQPKISDCEQHSNGGGSNSGSDGNCCAGCQLEKKMQPPISLQIPNRTESISLHNYPANDYVSLTSSTSRVANDSSSRRHLDANDTRVSSSDSPLYLLNLSLLI